MGSCQVFSKHEEKVIEVDIPPKKPDPKNYLMNVIKIQAIIRGHLARKKCFGVRMGSYNERVTDNLHSFGIDYTLKSGKKLAPFTYTCAEKDQEDPYFEDRQFRPAVDIPNVGTYKGEWLVCLLSPCSKYCIVLGSVTTDMDEECRYGLMDPFTKGTGGTIKLVYMVGLCMPMEMYMKESGSMIKLMGMELITM